MIIELEIEAGLCTLGIGTLPLLNRGSEIVAHRIYAKNNSKARYLVP